MQEDIKTLSERSGRDITLEAIKSGRILDKANGWQDFTYTLTDTDVDSIAALIGGHSRTQRKIVNCLRSLSTLRHHWSFRGLHFCRSKHVWEYTAGQDYTHEMQQIRNYFNNL